MRRTRRVGTIAALTFVVVAGCSEEAGNTPVDTGASEGGPGDTGTLEGPADAGGTEDADGLRDAEVSDSDAEDHGGSSGPLLPPAAVADSARFTTSGRCARCHSVDPSSTAMTDARGRAIGPFDLWQSSMMANSARDPIFRAGFTPVEAPHMDESRVCSPCHVLVTSRFEEARRSQRSAASTPRVASSMATVS